MSLTLALVLALCLALVEGVRQNTLYLETECVTDMGMNSVLAEYHRELQERYNLFFIDSSYGTDYPSYYNTEAHLREYMEKNVSLSAELGLLADNPLFSSVYMDPLRISFPEIKVVGVSLATDSEGYFLQKQAVQVIRNEMGIGVLENLVSWMETVEMYQLLDNSLDQEIRGLEEQLSNLEGQQQIDDTTWIPVVPENPVSELTENRRQWMLNWVLDREDISEKRVNTAGLISARRKGGQVNKGNIVSEGKLSFSERLLFQEYLCRYTGNFIEPGEECGLDYQLEYILFGENSDGQNLQKSALAICALRETANLLSLMQDTERREMIAAVASVLAAALLIPEAEPLFSGLILIGWSCLESLEDTKYLLKGGRVPLMKKAGEWTCSLENVFDGTGRDEKHTEEGLTYLDYLRCFLCFENMEDLTYRFMDIVEMDIRRTEGNDMFRMDGCIDYLEVLVTAESPYGWEYSLRHGKGYR